MDETADMEEVLRLSNEYSPEDYVPLLMAECEVDERVRHQCMRLLMALALAHIRFASFWALHFDKVMIFIFESMDELKT